MKRDYSDNEVLEDSCYIEPSKELLIDKLVMKEMLNAEEFNTLMKIMQEEFKRTFCISEKSEEERDVE